MNIPIKDRERKLEQRAALFLKEHDISNTVDVAVRAFRHKPYESDYRTNLDNELCIDESR